MSVPLPARSPSRRRAAVTLAGLALPALLLLGAPPPGGDAPDPATMAESLRTRTVAASPLGVVVTSTPEASWAGVRMLEAGGNAVDAAVAAAFALTASDPGGSGLGGQTWMLVRLASGEERAVLCPARAPMRLDREAVKAARVGSDLWGPKAAAVPTTVATLAHALGRYGTRSFAEVLAPAIEAADAGYRIQSAEHAFLGDYARRLFDSDVLSPVYLTGPTGESGIPDPAPVGTCVWLPGLADTLRRLAVAGPKDFYAGRIAAALVEETRAAGGLITKEDLARVPASVLDLPPVRGSYRGLTALSVPAPAGGSTLVMALQILDALPSATLAAPGLARGHAIVEAVRLARAEAGARRLATEVTEGPLVSEWLTRRWAATRAARIRPGRAIPREELHEGGRGLPPGPGTSHLSVVDADGNAVSLTQSLGRYYGAAWAPPSLGFPLNAFLEPLGADDRSSPAWLGPGASQPLPVAPLVLVKGGRVVLVAGTGGSSRIPSILLGFLAGVVDAGESPAEACARPRLLWEDDSAGPRVMLEVAPPFTADDAKALLEVGYDDVFTLAAPDRNTAAFGGVHAIAWDAASASWVGIADGRRPATVAVPSRVAPPPG